ncbi:MAG: PorT family protein [Prevotellaceae bacterium]|jgi:hypothetical protein|nr:PorT family protein [Prevotellaceae bacterium]
MKNNNYLLVLIILFPLTLTAQQRLDKSEKYLGVSAGATGAMVGFSPAVGQDYLLGYNGGFIYRYIADTYVGVQIELNYARQGWHEPATDFSRQLSYIELPFLTHVYLGKKSRFIVNIGPQLGYLINDRKTKTPAESKEVQHVKQAQNSFDYGFALGTGFCFSVNKNIFQLEARAYYAMGDIYSNAKTEYFSRSNNMKLSLNLSWLLQVK